MKTVYILALVAGLQFTSLLASASKGDGPVVADFSDGAPVADVSTTLLAPLTPKVAEFEDTAFAITSLPAGLAPVTPATADFEDQI